MRARPALALTALTACTALLGGLTSGLVPGPPSAYADGARPEHSSDGVRGEIAPRIGARGRVVRSRTELAAWQVAPGVTYRAWEQTDARGPVRAHLLTIDPGVRLDVAAGARVPDRQPVSSLVAAAGAVAGVNGDFFDIDDTGAPLGVGRSVARGLLHGPETGWNTSFWLDRRSRPRIGEVPVVLGLKQRPRWRLAGLNSPTVPRGRIGVYTRAWGRTSGASVTEGQRRRVREVVVKRHRVVEVRRRLSTDRRIRGLVLVGRGPAARQLRSLRPGQRVRLQARPGRRARLVLSGNKALLAGGVAQVVDDRELHPRTAIGIDRDTGTLLVLVVDGRSEESRGLTMVELASMMTELGAEDALNLDGGGSSTMVARDPEGLTGVRNVPSDGVERIVPNGLVVLSD